MHFTPIREVTVKKLIVLGILAVSAVLLAPACDRNSEAGRTVDCAKICSKYSECIKEIDKLSCTNECEDKADADSSYQTRAADCTDCVSDRTCKEADSCWTSCPAMPAVTK